METEIKTQSELQHVVNESPGLLIYFYNDSCAPCKALRPKIKAMMDDSFPKMQHIYINAAIFPQITSAYGVFASPTIITFFDGKETIRVSKYISINELSDKITRYYNLIFGGSDQSVTA